MSTGYPKILSEFKCGQSACHIRIFSELPNRQPLATCRLGIPHVWGSGYMNPSFSGAQHSKQGKIQKQLLNTRLRGRRCPKWLHSPCLLGGSPLINTVRNQK